MDKITIITYTIIIGITSFLAFMMIMGKTLNFTSREFCILKGKLDSNKTVDDVTNWDSSCFHPFDRDLPMFECRIKCFYR